MHWLTFTSSIVVAAVSMIALLSASPALYSKTTISRSDDASETWNVLHHLGGNSPWRVKTNGVLDSGLAVPDGCVVDQLHMMARHGERYPTAAAGMRMLELYQRIRQANLTLMGDLSFVNEWDFFAPYPSQQFEQLTTTGDYAGSLAAFTTGVRLRTRYASLIERALLASDKVSFWATDSSRVIHTARHFASAFFGIDWSEFATLHVVPKGVENGGNALSPGRGCPNYIDNLDGRGHQYGAQQLRAFQSTYLPLISHRLQLDNPAIRFTDSEIYSMQEMCGFETLAKGQTSHWCSVFTQDEWESFEYARDLLHYYRAGPGNRYGPTMGWLWLNATANLLQQGPEAGPLFLSFNHDGDIVALLAALDLMPQVPHLPTSHVDQNRTWRTSDVVPMGGRVIFERFACPAPQYCWNNGPLYPNHVYCNPPRNDTFVRINVNDGIVRLPGCDEGPGSTCPLEAFLRRVQKRGDETGGFKDVCGLPDSAPDGVTFLHH